MKIEIKYIPPSKTYLVWTKDSWSGMYNKMELTKHEMIQLRDTLNEAVTKQNHQEHGVPQ